MKSALWRTAPLYSCKYPRKYLVDFELPHSPHCCSLSIETFFKTTSKLQSLLQTAVHCTKLIYFKLLIPSAQFIKGKQPKSSQVKLLKNLFCQNRERKACLVFSLRFQQIKFEINSGLYNQLYLFALICTFFYKHFWQSLTVLYSTFTFLPIL